MAVDVDEPGSEIATAQSDIGGPRRVSGAHPRDAIPIHLQPAAVDDPVGRYQAGIGNREGHVPILPGSTRFRRSVGTFCPAEDYLSEVTHYPVDLELQREVDALADQVQVQFKLIDNHATYNGFDASQLGADSGLVFRAEIRLTNAGPQIEQRPGWAIHLSSIRRLLLIEDDRFDVQTITGDLHRLVPTAAFRGFAAGETVVLPIFGEFWMLFRSDVLPRWYVAGLPGVHVQPKVIRSTDTEDLTSFVAPIPAGQHRRSPWDVNPVATAAARFRRWEGKTVPSEDEVAARPIPQAVEVLPQPGSLDLRDGVRLAVADGCLDEGETAVLRSACSDRGLRDGPTSFRVAVDPAALPAMATVPGGYRLEISPQGAVVTGFDAAGARHGVRCLLSLVPGPGRPPVLPSLLIHDAPRFGYRGLCLDLARNFITPRTVAAVIEQMAVLRMNQLHLHLTDDEAWRVEITALPELTDVGSRRMHSDDEADALLPQLGSGPDDTTTGSGYYSRSEYIELVRAAQQRGITIIPEVDTPAHSRAAVVAMEARYRRLKAAGATEQEASQFRLVDPDDTTRLTTIQYYDRKSTLDPFVPGTEAFLRTVIGAFKDMHAQAGQPLRVWHYGGDEAANVLLGKGFSHVNDPRPDTGLIDTAAHDQPWAGSPGALAAIAAGTIADFDAIPTYMAKFVAGIAAEFGVTTLQAWQDGLRHAAGAADFPIPTRINAWDTTFWGAPQSLPAEVAKGYEVVACPPDFMYLDFPSEIHDLEGGYYWGGRYVDAQRIFAYCPENPAQNAEIHPDRDGHPFQARESPMPGRIAGISAAVFTELIRTDEQLLGRLFPRLIAVAERAWHRGSWELPADAGRVFEHGTTTYTDTAAREQAYAQFAAAVGYRTLPWLDASDIAYRVPTSGAIIRDGRLHTLVACPGIVVQVSSDDGLSWRDAVEGETLTAGGLVRSKTSDGRRFSRTDLLPLLAQEDLEELAGGLALLVQIADNQAETTIDAPGIGAAWGNAYRLRVTLTNSCRIGLPAAGWELHLPSLRRLLTVADGSFSLRHITGDHYVLAPADNFAGLAPGSVLSIDLIGETFILQEPEILPRWYLTAPGCRPAVLACTDTEDTAAFVAPIAGPNLLAGPQDSTVVVTLGVRYSRNDNVDASAPARLIPTPLQLNELSGSVDLRGGLRLVECPDTISAATRGWWKQRADLLGISWGADGAIGVSVTIDGQLLPDEVRRPEGYRLSVTGAGITVVGFDERGAGWALMTLFGLLPAPGGAPAIACCEIADAPRYGYRSLMLDIGRQFRGPAYLRRLLDTMASYKTNVLHLHLTEDEGWRLEIVGLPELTSVGGRRGHTPDESDRLNPQLGSGPTSTTDGSGFLTTSEYVELVRYADARGITVIPEINMPGHSRAAVMSMEARYHRLLDEGNEADAAEFRLVDPADTTSLLTVQYYHRHSMINPAVPGAHRFVEHVMRAVLAMHEEAGQPLRTWHTGGDEVCNVLLGAGYSDVADPRPDRGVIDRSAQHEPWGGSPMARAMALENGLSTTAQLGVLFAQDVARIARRCGLNTIHAWQDALAGAGSAADFPLPAVAEVWVPASEGAVETILRLQRGQFGTVGCAPDFTYFDAPYEAHPRERGLTWATRGLDEREAFSYPPGNPAQAAATRLRRLGAPYRDTVPDELHPMVGIQAHLWSETCRTDEQVDYMLFPRCLATAERAWHRASWEQDPQPGRSYGPGEGGVDTAALAQDYSSFAVTLGTRELAKLDAAGVAYRVPPPGVVVDEEGVLLCNVALPGLPLEISIDDGRTWVDEYPVVLEPGQSALVRVLSADRLRSSSVERVVRGD